MTGTTPTTVAPSAVAGLRPFVNAGLIDAAGLHLAASLARLAPGTTLPVLLASALLLREVRRGHSCMRLEDLQRAEADSETTAGAAAPRPATSLDWPDLASWTDALRSSELVTVLPADDPASTPFATMRPLVLEGDRLSLHRYWCHETTVAERLRAASDEPAPAADASAIDPVVARLFPDGGGAQADAVRTALHRRLTVLAGGPGTGKTYTVARMLAALFELDGELLPQAVAIAAPTGKAAARLTESVRQAVDGLGDAVRPSTIEALASLTGTTVHRLLGSRGGTAVSFDRDRPLPQRVVVIDETSMVDLPLMARLLDALRSDSRLVLVGDPDQLASVDVGTVLADIVGRERSENSGDATATLRPSVIHLRRGHRFGADSAIAALADAIRSGDAGTVIRVLDQGGDVRFVDLDEPAELATLRQEVVAASRAVVDAAQHGTAADRAAAQRALKVLSASHHGEVGVDAWRDLVESALGVHRRDTWYVGRAVMVTRNDPGTGLFNGDTGVTVEVDGRRLVAIDDPSTERLVRTVNLPDVDTWWSMTIHKSQGSEFDHVVVCFDSPRESMLTRELLYTAVTRARRRLTVVGRQRLIEAAVRRPVARASGLGDRLWTP